jgi:hypothetical protein
VRYWSRKVGNYVDPKTGELVKYFPLAVRKESHWLRMLHNPLREGINSLTSELSYDDNEKLIVKIPDGVERILNGDHKDRTYLYNDEYYSNIIGNEFCYLVCCATDIPSNEIHLIDRYNNRKGKIVVLDLLEE